MSTPTNGASTVASQDAPLTIGTGQPPAGWDPDEAAERMRVQAHGRAEHARWLAETDENGRLVNACGRCQEVRP